LNCSCILPTSSSKATASRFWYCNAYGIDPGGPHSPSAVSRLPRSLRNTFGVIDYEPLQRRRPRIRLAPARPGTDIPQFPSLRPLPKRLQRSPPSSFRCTWTARLLGRMQVLDRGV
jgi:hypothetical protein